MECEDPTKPALWTRTVFEVVLGCLDSPHKGTVKAAEDCFKALLAVMSRRGIHIVEVGLPLIQQIPMPLRKRKMLSLIYTVEYLSGRDEVRQVECYIKYALESVLYDNSALRLGSLCVEAILTRLRKACTTTEDWMSTWCDDFIATLSRSGDKIFLLSNSMVSIVLNIDSRALPLMVRKVLLTLETDYMDSLIVVLLTLLVEARRLKKLKYSDTKLTVAGEVEIDADVQLQNLIFNSSDTNAILLALSLCVSNPKVTDPSENVDRQMFQRAVTIRSTNTYDDFLEKHMKLCRKYIGDMRLKHNPAIGRMLGKTEAKTKATTDPKALAAMAKDAEKEKDSMVKLKEDLTALARIASQKLRIDGIYENIHTPLSVLQTLWEYFSDLAGVWKLYDVPTALFLIHSLASTWDVVRTRSYNVLEAYPIDVLTMDQWHHYAVLALQNLSSPRATEAEGAALYLKLLYSKHLVQLPDFDLQWDKVAPFIHEKIDPKMPVLQKQLIWVRNMLARAKAKKGKLSESLFKKASSEDLMHGEMRFVGLAISSMKFEQSATGFAEWKAAIESALGELQSISDFCEGMLSSAGIIDEETGNIIVDCRGRLSQMSPAVKEAITKAAANVKSSCYYSDDYENLLSTGIWLIAKESGNLYKVLADWLIFPGFSLASWLTVDEVKTIAFSLLDKILAYKHRGAFLKLVEALQVIVSKCTRSSSAGLQAVPGFILDKIFAEIQNGTSEANKTLRRSAGIPHGILAVLRAEAYPVLLDKTIKWMLERTKDSTPHDLRVHALNILKAIFEDSEIRQDIQSFMYDALMVATQGLSDPQWKVRNSSLMVFTAATKRIFGSCSTLEQQLNRQGKSVYEFFGHSDALCKFMLAKLQEAGPKNDPNTKFAIFPILLLFSRLAPSPFVKTKMQVAKFVPSFKAEMMKMLGHPDIGIREISAKALLPLIDPCSYLSEALTCLAAVKAAGPVKVNAKPNLVHGMLEFALQLLRMHFKRPTSGAEAHKEFVKGLAGLSFLLNIEQPLIHVVLSRIVKKFMQKEGTISLWESVGVNKELVAGYFEAAVRSCIELADESVPGSTNGLREKVFFIIRILIFALACYIGYETIYGCPLEGTKEILAKFIKAKEWQNVAWCFRTIYRMSDRLEKRMALVPCMESIKLLAENSLDAMKYCLKCLMVQMPLITQTSKDVNAMWDVLNFLKAKYKSSQQVGKLTLVFGCELVKHSLRFDIKDWLAGNVGSIRTMVMTLYDTQYNEDRHPVRVAAAVAFADLIELVNPQLLVKNAYHPDLVELHFGALRVLIQLMNSDNAEIRGFIARKLSESFKTTVSVRVKSLPHGEVTTAEEKVIVIKEANFNEDATLALLFDRVAATAAAKPEAMMKGYVELMWTLVRNLYFLENEQRNEGRNLIFVYEPLNGFMNNVGLKLFALERLAKVADLGKYLKPTEDKEKLWTGEEAVRELWEIHKNPCGTTRLAYIKFVDKLVRTLVQHYLLGGEKEKVKEMVKVLEKSGAMNRAVMEVVAGVVGLSS